MNCNDILDMGDGVTGHRLLSGTLYVVNKNNGRWVTLDYHNATKAELKLAKRRVS